MTGSQEKGVWQEVGGGNTTYESNFLQDERVPVWIQWVELSGVRVQIVEQRWAVALCS